MQRSAKSWRGRAIGLNSISDGEFRRQSYIVDFFRKALGSGGLTAKRRRFFHRNEQGRFD
jgi:hypothetical protein